MTFDLFYGMVKFVSQLWQYWKTVGMAFANMQVSELWPLIGPLVFFMLIYSTVSNDCVR